MQYPVEDGGLDDSVAEHLAIGTGALVSGQDHRSALIPAADITWKIRFAPWSPIGLQPITCRRQASESASLRLFGDKGYVKKKLKGLVRKAGLFWDVSLKASKQHPLTEAKKRFNHKMSSIGPRSYRRLISPGISGLRPGARSACSRSHAGGRPRSQPR